MSKKALKLLAKMRASKSGWTSKDFETLYTGFGFEQIETGGDTKFRHPKYPLWAYVSRSSGDLATGYAVTAVRTIDELERLTRLAENES